MAVWAVAQYDSNSNSESTGKERSIEGCLGGSPGNLTLTNVLTGTTYRLTGDTAAFGDKVGHTFLVNGFTAAGQRPSSMSEQSGSSQMPTLSVDEAEHISGGCRDMHNWHR
jgi:hypothetical protein